MLINIHNLPSNIRYADIKMLLQTTCGVQDVILDNLLSDGVNAKKVTVGVPGNAEASMISKTLNGYYINNMKLIVELMGQNKMEAKPYYSMDNDFKQNQFKNTGPFAGMAQMYGNQSMMQMMSPRIVPNPMDSCNTNTSGMNYCDNTNQTPFGGNSSQQQYDNSNMVPPLVSYPIQQNYSYGYTTKNFQKTLESKQGWYSNSNNNNNNAGRRNFQGQSGFDSNYQSRQSNDRRQTGRSLPGVPDQRPTGRMLSGSPDQFQTGQMLPSPPDPRRTGRMFSGSSDQRDFRMSQVRDHERDRKRKHSVSPVRGQSYSRQAVPIWSKDERNVSRSFNQMGQTSRDDYQTSEISYNRFNYTKRNEGNERSWPYGGHVSMSLSRDGRQASPPAKRNRWSRDVDSQQFSAGYREPSPSNDHFSRGSRNNYGVPNVSGLQGRDDRYKRMPREEKSSSRYLDKPREERSTFHESMENNAQTKLCVPTNYVFNSDETIRGQAAHKIAKTILSQVKTGRTIPKLKILKNLTKAVRARLIILLGTTVQLSYGNCWKVYRQKFSEKDDQNLYDIITERQKLEMIKTESKPKHVAEQNTSSEPTPSDAGDVTSTRATKKTEENIPRYPHGDKQLFREHRKHYKIQSKEGPQAVEGDPNIKITVAKEIDEIEKVILQKLEADSVTALGKELAFFERFKKEGVSFKINRVLQLNLLRRLLNSRVNPLVRIQGYPRLPKKSALTEFLKGKGVIGLKKSIRNPVYFATCWSYDSFDSLCALGKATIGDVTVGFRPMYLTGPLEKSGKNQGQQETLQESVDELVIDDDLRSDDSNAEEFDEGEKNATALNAADLKEKDNISNEPNNKEIKSEETSLEAKNKDLCDKDVTKNKETVNEGIRDDLKEHLNVVSNIKREEQTKVVQKSQNINPESEKVDDNDGKKVVTGSMKTENTDNKRGDDIDRSQDESNEEFDGDIEDDNADIDEVNDEDLEDY